MQRCQSSNRHEAYGVNASCPEETVDCAPSTPASTWPCVVLFFSGGALTAVAGVLKTPDVGAELAAAGVVVPLVVVPSIVAVVVVDVLFVVVVVAFVVTT